MHIASPYHFDQYGRTAESSGEDYIHALIEQVLFTSPGERVNRPDFGSGIMQLVFARNNEAVAATVQMTVQAALQKWLGSLIQVNKIEVANEDSRLIVAVNYTVRALQETRTGLFERAI
jgi:phage baseplate assembly protein W